MKATDSANRGVKRWAPWDPPFYFMALSVDLKKLESLLQPVVQDLGYELVDVLWFRGPGGWTMQLTIDRKPGEGHVSHQDCIVVSDQASALLDVHDLLPGAYQLEVSSPGPQRPLKTPRDFERFLQRPVRVKLKESHALQGGGRTVPQKMVRGTLVGCTERSVEVLLPSGEQVTIALEGIERATLVEG